MSIATSSHCSNIQELNLKQNQVGNDGIRVLTVGSLHKLRSLNVNQNQIDDMGYRFLADCEVMNLLTDLCIYEGNPASNEAKNLLRRSKKLCSLRYIS